MDTKGPNVVTPAVRRLLVALAFLAGIIGFHTWTQVWQQSAAEVLMVTVLVGLILGALRLWRTDRRTARHR